MIINEHQYDSRHQIELKPGDSISLCRCWRSAKFPYCDGAHRGHCETAGDDVGPVRVSVAEDASK